MSSLIESQKRKSHEDTLKRPSSVTSDESDHTSSVGGKIGMKRRVSVKVNRQEVVDYLKNTEKEQKSSKSSKLREKSTKAIEIKSPTPIKEPEQRNLRHRKSEVVVVPAETRNKRKASAHDETERNEKRGRKEPREVATLKKEATLASSKSKESEIKPRSAKKAKENIDNSTVITVSKHLRRIQSAFHQTKPLSHHFASFSSKFIIINIYLPFFYFLASINQWCVLVIQRRLRSRTISFSG